MVPRLYSVWTKVRPVGSHWGRGFTHGHWLSSPLSVGSGIGVLYSHFINASPNIKPIHPSNKNQLVRIGASIKIYEILTYTFCGKCLFGNEASGDINSLLRVIIKIFSHPNARVLTNQKGTSSKSCEQPYRCISAEFLALLVSPWLRSGTFWVIVEECNRWSFSSKHVLF